MAVDLRSKTEAVKDRDESKGLNETRPWASQEYFQRQCSTCYSCSVGKLYPSLSQSIETSASAPVLPMNIQDWSPLEWTGWISLQSKGLIWKDPDVGKDWRREEKGSRSGGWMASLTQWTRVWVNSRSWWWTGRPGMLQSMGSPRVGHDWVTSLSLFTFMHGRRKWQPTPVFLPGEPQGWGSLVGCCLWGRTESDTTEVT